MPLVSPPASGPSRARGVRWGSAAPANCCAANSTLMLGAIFRPPSLLLPGLSRAPTPGLSPTHAVLTGHSQGDWAECSGTKYTHRFIKLFINLKQQQQQHLPQPWGRSPALVVECLQVQLFLPVTWGQQGELRHPGLSCRGLAWPEQRATAWSLWMLPYRKNHFCRE